jgi:hypothetical protein
LNNIDTLLVVDDNLYVCTRSNDVITSQDIYIYDGDGNTLWTRHTENFTTTIYLVRRSLYFNIGNQFEIMNVDNRQDITTTRFDNLYVEYINQESIIAIGPDVIVTYTGNYLLSVFHGNGTLLEALIFDADAHPPFKPRAVIDGSNRLYIVHRNERGKISIFDLNGLEFIRQLQSPKPIVDIAINVSDELVVLTNNDVCVYNVFPDTKPARAAAAGFVSIEG